MTGRILACISSILLAAHALRIGNPGAVTFWLMSGGLVFFRPAWCGLAVGGLMLFGSTIWFETCIDLVRIRLDHGYPWIRLAFILGTVAAVALAAGLFNFRRSITTKTPGEIAKGSAFLLTVGGLAMAKYKTSLDIILADRFFPTFGWVAVFLLGWYAAWITGRMHDPRQSPKWRRITWSLFSAVFFTQLLLGLLGIEQFLMTGKLHLPVPALIAAGPLFRGEGFFMIVLFAVTLILVGPAWCSHLCYIGAWDNLSACSKKRARPLTASRGLIRICLCLLVLGAAILLRFLGVDMQVAVAAAAAFGCIGVLLMLTWSRKTGTMAHCTAYCPMGLIADIFGKVNPWRIRIKPGCTRCGVCTGVCRYDALTPADIEAGKAGLTCSLCGDCISGCPHTQLTYTFPGLQPDTARLLFVVMAVSLHAIFMGVARL